jgi:hypothetical protein
MTVEAPHFSLPFRFAPAPGGGVAPVVVEQDSLDEIADAVTRVTQTERGTRDDLPSSA